MRPRGLVLRVAVVTATMASVLVPALTVPARTITVPTTLTRSRSIPPQGRLAFDFEPTHVTFTWSGVDGAAVRYRTVSATGELSGWTKARESHDMEHGDRHYSAVLAVYGASAIRWEPIEGKDATDIRLEYMNTLDGPRRTVEIPALAGAEASTPDIVTRAEWGADESIKSTSGGCTRRFFKVQQLFVHHTAGVNYDPHPRATMRAIYQYHTVSRGWCDVGYNFVISPDGTIFEGRWARSYKPWETHTSELRDGRAVAGAHVANYNSGSVGISMMGNFSQVELPPLARRALAELLAWEADRHNLAPRGTHIYRNPETGLTRQLPFIAGHRDAGSTECPGNLLYASLKGIRRDTEAVIGDGKPSSQITLAAQDSAVSYGEPATFTGSLTDESGAGLAARPITIYQRTDGIWGVAGETSTGADGTYSFATTASETLIVRAVYSGDTSSWGADSGTVKLAVRPEVTIQAQGGTVDGAGLSHYPTGTTGVPLAGSVTPSHPGVRVFVHVDRLQPDGSFLLVERTAVRLDSESAYSHVFAVPGGGTYRATTHFPGDSDHASSWSDYATFVVDP